MGRRARKAARGGVEPSRLAGQEAGRRKRRPGCDRRRRDGRDAIMTLFDLLTASKAAAKAGDLERARHLVDRMTPFTDDEWLAFDAWAKELDGLEASQCNTPADPRDYIGAPRQALSFEYAIAGSYDEARRMLDAKKEAKRAAAEKANPAKRRPKGRVERAGS